MQRSLYRVLLGFALAASLAVSSARADNVYGKIRGTVTDASGAAIPAATVTARNTGTGVSYTSISGADGNYEFVQLPAPATYDVSVQQSGFRSYQADGISLLLDHTFVQNITLEIGAVTQQVTVEANPTQVETTSMQGGTDLTARDVTELPLIGRNWIQLQQTLPGTVSNSDRFGGDFATNGSRAQFNSYMVNGTDANDFPLNLAVFVASPDAIGEVHIITDTMNPEYGRDSGAILNAVTKSGTNQLHGDGFEFFRDTSLNDANFLSHSAQIFHQNLFGGTVGGPIKKDRTFFFFSYQGIRNVQPETGASNSVPVFTPAQRGGAFTDIPNCASKGLACASPFPMVGENGTTYPSGTPYATLFPTGSIPMADLNPIAVKLMNTYVPLPNSGSDYNFNPTSAELQDQEIFRVDQNFSTKDTLWVYGTIQREPTTNILPFSGSDLPGFPSVSQSHYYQFTADWNHIFNGTTLNEARIGYSRLNFNSNFPEKVTLPSSAGFAITPQHPEDAGLPVIALTGYFTLGFSANGPQPRIDQTYQVTDNFSKIVGNHAFKTGFEMRRMQVYNPFLSNNGGNFTFGGAGTYSTGDAGADFLLGIPDSYTQSTGDIIDARAQMYFSYFQDQYKWRPNLTWTYGVTWQFDTPIEDIYHNRKAIICWIPGQQSKVWPTAPVGLNYPSDPGCSVSGYSAKPAHFGPRFGFAWSPSAGKLTGGPGKTSIRGGFGVYFDRTEEEVTLQNLNSVPYGLASSGAAILGAGYSPSFANPFADVGGKGATPNPFPYTVAANPNFAALAPIFVNTIAPNFTNPYSMNYNLTVERELGRSLIASVAYVGSEGRKLHSIYNLNPDINPAGCLAGAGAEAGCAANRTFQKVFYPQNAQFPGAVADGIYGIGSSSTFLNSNYNAFQATLTKRASHGLSFLASYTWAHTLDYASSFEDDSFAGLGFDPASFASNYGNAGIDARQRFTVSYVWNLPTVHRFDSNWAANRLVNGWEVSGVTTFQTGFPVQIFESTFRELRCDAFDFTICPDRPNVAAPVQTLNPRNSSFTVNGTVQDHYWFNPDAYSLEPLGTVGDVSRNPFHGPGINNFDFSVFKNVKLVGESKYIQLRFEFYNVFNHTQFDSVAIQTAGNTVEGNVASPNLGRLFSVFDPRLIQLGAKIYF